MQPFKSILLLALSSCLYCATANASFIQYDSCTGANACLIAPISGPIPNPIATNPNDGILLGWDEIQNFTLTNNLYIDRVANTGASYIGQDASGYYVIAGTMISSHYFQWDSGAGSSLRVNATLNVDANIFGFISSNVNLLASDNLLGLAGYNYSTFNARGLENNDWTSFAPGGITNTVDINWRATSPGDWARLITASAPTVTSPSQIPEPHALMLFGLGLFGLSRLKIRSYTNFVK